MKFLLDVDTSNTVLLMQQAEWLRGLAVQSGLPTVPAPTMPGTPANSDSSTASPTLASPSASDVPPFLSGLGSSQPAPGSSTSAATPPSTPSTPEPAGPAEDVDSRGYPYDESVHTKSKSKATGKKNLGQWKWGKGVSDKAKAAYLKRCESIATTSAPAETQPTSSTSTAAPQSNIFGSTPAPELEFKTVVEAYEARMAFWPAATIAEKIKEAGINPVGLEQRPESWAQAYEILLTSFPLQG